MAERQELLQFTASLSSGGCLAPPGLGRGMWEGSRVHTPTFSSPLALSPQLREAAVLRTVVEAVVEAEVAERVRPGVPL